MPNWCSNQLTLKHKDPQRVDLAVLAFNNGKFFETFVPLPDGKWNYDFCVTKWGTKWDVGGSRNDDEVDRPDRNTAVFVFDSAWAPPVGVYEAMCSEGYEIEAFYDEPGMAFCGKIVGNEHEWDDDYREYGSVGPEAIRTIVGEELDDFYGLTERMAEWDSDVEDDEQELIDELERIRNLGPHTD